MQNVGAGWLMTQLSDSPLMVSLVQAASAIPVFVAVLPAGALADMVDRRRLLLFTQSWMIVAAAGSRSAHLASTRSGPWMLLAFTFLLGIGAVMNDPAWQAITPDVVSPAQHCLRRCPEFRRIQCGPRSRTRAWRIVVASAGAGWSFLLNAASFFGVIYFLYKWKCAPRMKPLATNGIGDAITRRIPLRSRRATGDVCPDPHRRIQLWRRFAARTSASRLPATRSARIRLPAHLFWTGRAGRSSAVTPDEAAVFGRRPGRRRNAAVCRHDLPGRASPYLFNWFCLVLFTAGAAWIGILACFNVVAQTMCPSWMRARALSMYLLVLQGGMAVGSAHLGRIGRAARSSRGAGMVGFSNGGRIVHDSAASAHGSGIEDGSAR